MKELKEIRKKLRYFIKILADEVNDTFKKTINELEIEDKELEKELYLWYVATIAYSITERYKNVYSKK